MYNLERQVDMGSNFPPSPLFRPLRLYIFSFPTNSIYEIQKEDPIIPVGGCKLDEYREDTKAEGASATASAANTCTNQRN